MKELTEFHARIAEIMQYTGHNLLSTASNEERSRFIYRILNAWNTVGRHIQVNKEE